MKAQKYTIILSFVSLVVSLITIVAWCAVSFRLKPLEIATYESVIVSVLGILITLLIGWNIYSVIDVKEARQEMIDCIKKADEMKTSINETKTLSDAYAFMGLAEMFLSQNKYIYSYTKFIAAILNFKKAGEHNIAIHQCGRIYMLIRTIRRNIAKKQHDYILDYDLFHDIAYEKDFSELSLLDLEQYDAIEMRDIFLHDISQATKYFTINDVEYVIFNRDADIKKRPIAIYLLLENGEVICKTKDFDNYIGLLICNLNLNHDSVAVAEFTSIEKLLRAYELINAPEISKQDEKLMN
ncbi:MAG: hypothetical protein MJZ96_03055 [Paludibacteraceae bacterium]|nr:hypothetical protein [Paludibacteraceae bacterium]